MAEKKIKIDPSSLDNVANTLKKSIEEGFKKGAQSLDSSGLEKKLDETFSMKGLRKGLAGAFKTGALGSEKTKKKQADMTKILAKNASLSKSFTNAISSGASKGKIMNAGLKLASNHVAGMVKNINPYVAALAVSVKLIKEFSKHYQKTLETSSKFITAGSLFTNKDTMNMMQRTGQSASGAQGTNRALDRLGISFDDIQSGRVTAAQMKEFEKIRKEETARLEEISKHSGTFEAMQKSALAMARMKQFVDDTITLVFAKSKGVMTFAKQLKGLFDGVQGFVTQIGNFITPIVNLIGGVLGTVMSAVSSIMKVAEVAMDALSPIMDGLNEVVDLVMGTVGTLIDMVGQVLVTVIRPIGKILKSFVQAVMAPVKVVIRLVSSIIDAVIAIVKPIVDIVNLVFDIFSSMIPMVDAFKVFEPILKLVTTSIQILGAAIGWVVSKIGEGLKWVWDKSTGFINKFINLVPEAMFQMVKSIVDLVNQIPGVNIDVGEYKAINVGDMLNGLQGGLDKTLQSIQGDTFNYNTVNPQETTTNQNANVNLFANNYVLVND